LFTHFLYNAKQQHGLAKSVLTFRCDGNNSLNTGASRAKVARKEDRENS